MSIHMSSLGVYKFSKNNFLQKICKNSKAKVTQLSLKIYFPTEIEAETSSILKKSGFEVENCLGSNKFHKKYAIIENITPAKLLKVIPNLKKIENIESDYILTSNLDTSSDWSKNTRIDIDICKNYLYATADEPNLLENLLSYYEFLESSTLEYEDSDSFNLQLKIPGISSEQLHKTLKSKNLESIINQKIVNGKNIIEFYVKAIDFNFQSHIAITLEMITEIQKGIEKQDEKILEFLKIISDTDYNKEHAKKLLEKTTKNYIFFNILPVVFENFDEKIFNTIYNSKIKFSVDSNYAIYSRLIKEAKRTKLFTKLESKIKEKFIPIVIDEINKTNTRLEYLYIDDYSLDDFFTKSELKKILAKLKPEKKTEFEYKYLLPDKSTLIKNLKSDPILLFKNWNDYQDIVDTSAIDQFIKYEKKLNKEEKHWILFGSHRIKVVGDKSIDLKILKILYNESSDILSLNLLAQNTTNFLRLFPFHTLEKDEQKLIDNITDKVINQQNKSYKEFEDVFISQIQIHPTEKLIENFYKNYFTKQEEDFEAIFNFYNRILTGLKYEKNEKLRKKYEQKLIDHISKNKTNLNKLLWERRITSLLDYPVWDIKKNKSVKLKECLNPSFLSKININEKNKTTQGSEDDKYFQEAKDIKRVADDIKTIIDLKKFITLVNKFHIKTDRFKNLNEGEEILLQMSLIKALQSINMKLKLGIIKKFKFTTKIKSFLKETNTNNKLGECFKKIQDSE